MRPYDYLFCTCGLKQQKVKQTFIHWTTQLVSLNTLSYPLDSDLDPLKSAIQLWGLPPSCTVNPRPNPAQRGQKRRERVLAARKRSKGESYTHT